MKPMLRQTLNSCNISCSISVGSPPSALQSQDWAVPNPSRLKYTQLFNTHDRARSGHLSGPQARNILVQSQLPHPILAQIWNLADIDRDGRLSCEEFVLAMHLCDLAKGGERMPPTLSADLIPPSFRRQQRRGSVKAGAVAGAGTGITVGSPATPTAGIADVGEPKDPNVSFEDKRKENFEKGQAELERRRKALLEIQRKEHEERERKEREEQEKRERIRQEQERRRQAEFEKQLQRQREQEEQKEEERKRAQEQREAARREMERQRQLEWEKQRSQELQSQRQKEQEKVLQLKAKNQNLTIELSQLNEKVKDLTSRITETRSGVTGVKSTIDGMRATRDTKLQEASMLKASAKLKEQNQRLVALAAEKVRLEAKNKANMQAPGSGSDVIQTFTTDKQITLKQLRDRLDDMQKEIDGKMQDIENNNSQLNDLKDQLSTLVQECENIYTVYEDKRNKVIELKGGRAGDFNAAWGDNAWNAGSATTDSWGEPADTWPASTEAAPEVQPIPGFIRHRALYEFVARNADELSFQPGDIIMVPESHNAEPGWLAGELRGQTGWFPESYVERIDPMGSEVNLDLTAAVGVESLQVKRTLEGIQEVPENVSDSGSLLETTEAVPAAVADLGSPVAGQGEIVDFKAEAICNWKGTKASHLSLSQGDIVNVKEKQERMTFGEANGLSGWFPSSAIKVLSPIAEPVSADQAAEGQRKEAPNRMVPSIICESSEWRKNWRKRRREKVIALYPYTAQNDDELTFERDEVITVIAREESSWWRGEVDGRSGLFPSNYVEPLSARSSH
ncbi:hypothetical protein J437_LFUL000761 [Ladona fulva]|uniref:Intersectin-1 n=1 Tax=Ladona fulva TaxID=123851 RepID=A0A8K0PD03_LADFU|nr:hypothetical protein J437_LFUL000761 [Ladona fulva]